MIYPITVYGEPLLRKVCKPISPDYPDFKKLVEDMFETMYHSDGVGLAAPQIGLPIRMFVVDASAVADDEPELEGFKKAFINPEILELRGDEWTMNEGCLSLPEIREDVSRPEFVKIKYHDENFNEHIEEFGGFAARVIQHEYDHLEGKLLVDYLSPLRKRILKSRLTNITKGNVKTSYRILVPGSRK
ncbi:MAG: peptide deformylase [Mangrovibacterium sp.]